LEFFLGHCSFIGGGTESAVQQLQESVHFHFVRFLGRRQEEEEEEGGGGEARRRRRRSKKKEEEEEVGLAKRKKPHGGPHGAIVGTCLSHS